MVEGVHYVGDEVIIEAVEVEKMEIWAGVMCNKTWKCLIMMIGLNVLLFLARMR